MFDLGFEKIIVLSDLERFRWAPKSATLRSWTGLTLLFLGLLAVADFALERVLEFYPFQAIIRVGFLLQEL